jgi:hypothetical protein
MAIEEISRHEFDAFSPARSAMVMTIAEEVSWHADTARNIIGAMFLEKTDKDWGFVILGRDPKGEFRAIKVGASIATKKGAKAQLLMEIGKVEESGETVFPQD